MMSKSHQVLPFYNIADNPPLMPLLSYQAELVYQTTTPITVSAAKEMLTAGEYHALIIPARSLNKRPNTPAPQIAPRFKIARVVTPCPEEREKEHKKHVPYQRLEHSPVPSESSLSSLESEDDIQSGKIPKLNGEAGRLGRGGYNLEEKLGWGKNGFKQLKVRMYID